MFDDLDGKAVLVTGASRGIGAAIARGFAQAGARVAIHYNNSAGQARALADGIAAEGGKAFTLQGDFSDPEIARTTVRAAGRKLGGLDVLVNNAGAMLGRRAFDEIDGDLLKEVMNLNVNSLIAASQAALPCLSENGDGAIINLGSIAGTDGGGPTVAHYASAKGYVHTMTRSMARALAGRGIRVNAIAPGIINTDFHAATPPDIMANLKRSIVMGRLGVAEDCVGPTLFLASAAASGYVTGQILHVNGGQLMA